MFSLEQLLYLCFLPTEEKTSKQETDSRPQFDEDDDDDVVLNGMDAEAAVMAEEDQHEISDGFRRIASGEKLE